MSVLAPFYERLKSFGNFLFIGSTQAYYLSAFAKPNLVLMVERNIRVLRMSVLFKALLLTLQNVKNNRKFINMNGEFNKSSFKKSIWEKLTAEEKEFIQTSVYPIDQNNVLKDFFTKIPFAPVSTTIHSISYVKWRYEDLKFQGINVFADREKNWMHEIFTGKSISS